MLAGTPTNELSFLNYIFPFDLKRTMHDDSFIYIYHAQL